MSEMLDRVAYAGREVGAGRREVSAEDHGLGIERVAQVEQDVAATDQIKQDGGGDGRSW